jgi:type III pantothenate kinase
VKLARVEPSGRLSDFTALALEPAAPWEQATLAWARQHGPARWAVASVNPDHAGSLLESLSTQGVQEIAFLTSASSVRLAHRLDEPAKTGVDRALAVRAALEACGTGPGQVISCGTAITIERVDDDGNWDGGAILPGLLTAARSLRGHTAQLPMVSLPDAETPAAWGRSTGPAIAAGLVWGAAGALREILGRQAAGFTRQPWRVWTGGDAQRLAPLVEPNPRVVPDLVLRGLALEVFGAIEPWPTQPS